MSQTAEEKKKAVEFLHEKARELEALAGEEYLKDEVNDMHNLFDTARCLRVSANFIEGNNSTP